MLVVECSQLFKCFMEGMWLIQSIPENGFKIVCHTLLDLVKDLPNQVTYYWLSLCAKAMSACTCSARSSYFQQVTTDGLPQQ